MNYIAKFFLWISSKGLNKILIPKNVIFLSVHVCSGFTGSRVVKGFGFLFVLLFSNAETTELILFQLPLKIDLCSTDLPRFQLTFTSIQSSDVKHGRSSVSLYSCCHSHLTVIMKSINSACQLMCWVRHTRENPPLKLLRAFRRLS